MNLGNHSQGLSKKFIYFNDDVFLGSPVLPEDFVSSEGSQLFHMSWDVPKCAPGCADSWLGDGFCDKSWYVIATNIIAVLCFYMKIFIQ